MVAPAMEAQTPGRCALSFLTFPMDKRFPDIFLFNPTCEFAVANGRPSWQPNRLLQQMEKELEALMLFLMQPEDVLLVRELPPENYLQALKVLDIAPPRFFLIKDIAAGVDFQNQPKNRLLPWGWSPAAHRLLEPLKKSCSPEFQNAPVFNWKPEHKEIASRKFALHILQILPPEVSLSKSLFPKICTTKTDLEDCISRWGKIMVKSPWSSSGRGLQRVTKIPVVEKVWEKLLGMVREQGYVIAEPLLDKVLDMAFQFKTAKGKIEYLGVSRFFADEKGQYQGNFLNGWPDISTGKLFPAVAPEIIRFAETLPEIIIPHLISAMESSIFPQFYEGNFGVDILVFRDENGELQVNPCLEINVRQNMGLLSLRLENFVSPDKTGIFKTFYQRDKSFGEFAREMENRFPLQVKDFKIQSGFFPLTPIRENTLFGAYLLATD